jgi:2'-5' RNA ligase
MTGIRCFVAVDLPAQMREEIGRLESQIATEGLRLVRPDLVHVTLKFLGDVPEGKVQSVVAALSGVRVAPFAAKVMGMGTFPGRFIRVVWLGLEGDFQVLYTQVETSLCPFGFKREARGYLKKSTLTRGGPIYGDLAEFPLRD